VYRLLDGALRDRAVARDVDFLHDENPDVVEPLVGVHVAPLGFWLSEAHIKSGGRQ